jgi:hypothetical protein
VMSFPPPFVQSAMIALLGRSDPSRELADSR